MKTGASMNSNETIIRNLSTLEKPPVRLLTLSARSVAPRWDSPRSDSRRPAWLFASSAWSERVAPLEAQVSEGTM